MVLRTSYYYYFTIILLGFLGLETGRSMTAYAPTKVMLTRKRLTISYAFPTFNEKMHNIVPQIFII